MVPAVRGDPATPRAVGRFEPGQILAMLNRGDYWQCGFVIPKGSLERLRGEGLQAFRDGRGAARALRRATASASCATGTTSSCSPSGSTGCASGTARDCSASATRRTRCRRSAGSGINLAIQDAVAAANILAGPLREGQLTTADLRQVQRRRELPTRITQRLQLLVQERVIARVLGGAGELSSPLALRLMARFPYLRRLPARLVGIGVRPEHVRAPAS